MTTCRTLCGQLQLFTSAQTNPTPDLTLTKTPTVCGAGSRSARGRQGQSRGSAACFWWRYSEKAGAAEKPVSTNQASVLQEVICR